MSLRCKKEDKFAELKKTIDNLELIDAHAHNIVAINSSFPFIKCFTEADGDALSFAPHSLSFKRGVREIAELYKCKSSLYDIEEYRKHSGIDSVSSTCFGAARIAGSLIDHGLDFDNKYEIEWHKSYVPFVGRILRIEHLAGKILDEDLPDGAMWTLNKFTEVFVEKLKSLATTVVGLKSIAAYRGGLEIDPYISEKDAENGLSEVLSAGKPVRIANKKLIDYIFIRSLEVALHFDLPIQIHTGFGDKDQDLRTSNPLHLRKVLEDARFDKCRFVLLHASYPFSKEASYLASVYPQVYLDFGLGLLLLSYNGMKSAVKELLELAPIKKVMFSTDGYAFPEAFYLGARRAREVIFSILRDSCIDEDLSIPEALEAAKDLFAENAIQFYKIKQSVKLDPTKPYLIIMERLQLFCQKVITLVRIIWIDTSGQCRCRVVPVKRFHDVVKKNGVGLTFACMGMPSFMDGPVAESNLTGTGEIRLVPDMSTLRKIPWVYGEEMVLSDMHLKPGEPWEYCPREALRRVAKVMKEEFNLEMNAGFENEFYILKPVTRDGSEEWVPFDSTPYCSTSSYDAASRILNEMFTALQSLDISVEQIHAEAGKGQFEMALGHSVCTSAADNLVFAREAIRSVARKHGLLATFAPKYKLDDIGSGSHVHLSLWENGENVFTGSPGSGYGMSEVGQEFMAGVLFHLPAILAFTAPNPNSYDRIQPDTWSGAYHCWGKENREVPLRTACPPGVEDGLVSNFEIKSFDGCANPHLGLASIIAAGIDGLRRHLTLPPPIEANPSSLDGELQRLPTSLAESLDALHKDTFFKDFFGEKLLTAVKGVRKAEVAYYSQNKDAYKQLIYRY
ncbi:LOW QUALITY PROTEIN: protein fluG-like [Chenopodium quinoa]|uniref:LOW QUALITY PROTEIN: protein fluG-like n=1 Tax=Chenopodium quinoa TaxID=63459 RepID=UPI000B77F8C8|nr:LOW QUALITY PROTEIN: protein fluG-like [Chenopodium quinoa]